MNSKTGQGDFRQRCGISDKREQKQNPRAGKAPRGGLHLSPPLWKPRAARRGWQQNSKSPAPPTPGFWAGCMLLLLFSTGGEGVRSEGPEERQSLRAGSPPPTPGVFWGGGERGRVGGRTLQRNLTQKHFLKTLTFHPVLPELANGEGHFGVAFWLCRSLPVDTGQPLLAASVLLTVCPVMNESHLPVISSSII